MKCRSLRLKSFAALFVLGLSGRTFAADAPVQPNDFLAICGDSITEQRIYSAFIEEYILACQPVASVRSAQFGWSGDTTWGFLGNKLDNDVLRFHPTVATTCFGMNDGGYAKMTDGTAEHYRTSTQSIIDKMKAGGVRTIILGSPGCVGDELHGKAADAEVYNQTLKGLRDIDAQLAEKNGIVFADVFTPMMDVKSKAKAKYGPTYQTNGGDGIHPGLNGHLVMAYAFLKAMGFDGNVGTITVDMTAKTATASEGHKVLGDAVKDGTVEIDSTRYPFCFTGDPTLPNATTGVIEFLPFNQELNRFTLVVKNAPADKVKITWGTSSKEFTKDQLTDGINLAAEFLDNPFSAPFAQLSDAVAAQQKFETPFIKSFVVNVPGMTTLFGDEEKATLDHLIEVGVTKDTDLFEKAVAQVAPVHHTIKIEAAQ